MNEEKRKKIRSFLEKLSDHQMCLPDIMREIVPLWKKTDITFAIGIKESVHFYVIKISSKKECLETDFEIIKENVDDGYIAELILGEKQNEYTVRCRNINSWAEPEDENADIYYFAAIPKNDRFSYMYLNLVERAYFEWFVWMLFVESREMPDRITLTSVSREDLNNRIEDAFKKFIQESFNINLNFITGLSGTYYEGSECCATLSFCFMRPDNMDIEFKDSIELDYSTIRKVRKLMQVVQAGQSLIVYRNYKENRWEILGIKNIQNTPVSCINFHFFHHMVWSMKFEGKNVVFYDCGKYIIDFIGIKEEQFCVKYRSLFKKILRKK